MALKRLQRTREAYQPKVKKATISAAGRRQRESAKAGSVARKQRQIDTQATDSRISVRADAKPRHEGKGLATVAISGHRERDTRPARI